MIAKILTIKSAEDYLKLRETIPENYLSSHVMNLLRNSLSSLIKTVVIEYPYVDKDYRVRRQRSEIRGQTADAGGQ